MTSLYLPLCLLSSSIDCWANVEPSARTKLSPRARHCMVGEIGHYRHHTAPFRCSFLSFAHLCATQFWHEMSAKAYCVGGAFRSMDHVMY